jgi:phosphoglycerate dehydrogenase-like enzyme
MRITAFVFTVVASFVPQSVSSYAFQGPSRLVRRSALSMNVEQAATKENIKVGVIGMGRIGMVHLEAISKAPGVTAVIVSNPTVSKAEAGMYETKTNNESGSGRFNSRDILF